MGRVAVVFPGQGSQRPGMARDFYDRFAVSRDTFAESSEALGLDVARLSFDEDPRLDLTEFTQPALLTAEIAMLRGLGELGLAPTVFGGHSLGEYSALCACGAMPLHVAVRIVRTRGALMQEAVPAGQGAMTAVIGRGIGERDVGAAIAGLDVDIANVNSPDQIVLSGAVSAMDLACQRVREAASEVALDFKALVVSAPFHSRWMRSVEPVFRATLDRVASSLSPEKAVRVTSNLHGGFHSGDIGDLLGALERQISSPVKWIQNMSAIAGAADRIFEVGPSRPLRGFFQSVGVQIESLVSLRAAEKIGLA